jgi:hypothetical protein
MSDPPFVFATRKSEIKFWTKVADAIYNGMPYYHLTPTGKTCRVCTQFTYLGWTVESKIINLLNKEINRA